VIDLRDYQDRAVAAVEGAWAAGSVATLIVLPTGTGKTVTFAELIGRSLAAHPDDRSIVVVHREELVWQAVDKIRRVTGVEPAVEMADYRADAGGPMYGEPPVVVATVQTLIAGRQGPRMARFDPRRFRRLILDECHHGTAATWRRVVRHFVDGNPALRVLGVTATPDRADEQALGLVFDSVAFEYALPDAIRDGWLVPIRQQLVTVEGLDLSRVSTAGGDLNGAELAEVMEAESILHQVASPTVELCGDRRALVFAASVAGAERLAEILNRHRPDSADWVCGATPRDDRRRRLAAFADGRLRVMVNVGVLTEGFDDPGVEVVVMARPTKSRCLYAQMAGRGTRPLAGIVDRYDDADDRRMAIAESAKPWLEVIDFAGNSGRHKLVTTADILGGNYDDDVLDRARRTAAEAGGPVDMTAALEAALAAREAERAAEAARRAKLRVEARYTTQRVDPFDVFDLKPLRESADGPAGKPVSEKMRAFIEKHAPRSVDPDALNYAQARRLIAEQQRRWDAGQCSLKQAEQLGKRGLPIDVSREQAREWMDALANNRWQLTPELQAIRAAAAAPAAPVPVGAGAPMDPSEF
jgi:superfamily II DNA or RNA helicase